MATSDEIILKIKADTAAALNALQKINKEIGVTGTSAKKSSNDTAVGFAKATIAISAAQKAYDFLAKTMQRAVKDASNLQETQAKFSVVFQDNMEMAESFAQTLVDSYGLSENAAKAMLSHTGDILQGFGMQEKAALELSNTVQKLAVDLVSFSNYHGTTEEASRAITKAMLGEAEALEGLGKKILDDDVKRRAQADGYKLVNGQLDNQARALTVVKLLTEQSLNAMGDFERTSDSWANTMRIVDAKLEDVSASIGQELLPSLTRLAQAFLSGDETTNVFIRALKGVAQMAAVLVDNLTAIINKINTVRSLSSMEDKQKQVNALLGEQTKHIQEYAKVHGLEGKFQSEIVEHMRRRSEYEKSTRGGAATEYEIYKGISSELRTASGQASDMADQAVKSENAFNKTMRVIAGTNQEINKQQEKSTKSIPGKVKGPASAAELKAVEDAKRVAYELQAYSADKDKAEELSAHEKYRKITEAAAKHKEQLLKMGVDYNALMVAAEQEHQDQIAEIRNQAIATNIQNYAGMASQIVGQMQQTFNAYYAMQYGQMDNEYKKKRENIIKNVKDETEQKKQLDALDNDYAEKKKEMQKKQAEQQKALSLMQAIIGTAQAVAMALTAGPIAGPILAGIIGAMGAAQIAMIAATPVPEMAEGGLIMGSSAGTVLRAGEAGRSEAIIPLENEQAMEKLSGIGGTTIVVNVENLWGDDREMAKRLADSIDAELYRMKQDKRSRAFA